MGEKTWEVRNRESFETGVSNQGLLLIASRSDNPPGRSESAITEVSTLCARLWVLPGLAALTSHWSAVSMGPFFRCCERSVKSGYLVFRIWAASDRDEPCSPVLRRGLIPTEPRALTQRFGGDRGVL